ncbi:hypothetical protein KCU59_g23791, partial [Aureobasidium melanogenum]
MSTTPTTVSGATRRSQAAAEDSLACKECRRRKANCDHKIPECSTCKRYKRHCLYDRLGKTPLTRRHLTEVEHRLSRAEAILKRLFSDQEVAYLLDQERSGDVPVLPSIRNASQTQTPRTASPAGGSINSPASSHQQQSVTSQPQTSLQGSISLEDP